MKNIFIQVQKEGEQVDYLTFVPDGEPGLDLQLSETIKCLRPLGFPIAIISNASLIWREEIRETFARADWLQVTQLINKRLYLFRQNMKGKYFIFATFEYSSQTIDNVMKHKIKTF